VDIFFVVLLSGVQLFQFEPTYSPGEEPAESEKESEGEEKSLNFNAKVGNTEWCICGGNCTAMSKADECFCCQELDALNAKFRIVCLDTDVLHTTLVAIHNACCNPPPDPVENRLVF